MCRAGGRKHPHQEFTPVDTTNILFICGGAFVGLEKTIERRIGQKSLGFHTDAQLPPRSAAISRCSNKCSRRIDPLTADPRICGAPAGGRSPGRSGQRRPDANIDGTEEPLIRQYQRLFEFENVRLRFADDALETVADLALQRKVGARGLRMILEDLMLELMYHLPAQRKLREFLVTAEMVRSREINWTLLEKAG